MKEKVPSVLVAIGGISFVLGLFIHPLIAIIGVIDGLYIWRKYPKEKKHWLIPLLLNGVLFIIALLIIALEVIVTLIPE